jgi:hypothetical protein
VRRPRLAGFRFWLERLVIRGLKYRLLLASFIVVAVALIAGALAFVLAGDYSDPFDAVWWAFLRLTDPGYLGDDEGVAKRSISTVVTVLGYILFLGLLIAILTQWLNQTIAKLESGVTPVVLSDHVVVLGWTHQTRPIVASLLYTGARVKRFLARRGARGLHVVIMAEEVDDALRQRLIERFGRQNVGRRVLLRTGTPLRVDHLERVAYRDAAVIILPGAGFAESNPERVDSATVKTLASVSRFAGEYGSRPPFAVAEIFDVRNVSLANQAYKGDCEVIATDGMISRLIAQSVRYSGLWKVMSELFMHHEGNSIHIRRVEGQAGQKFRDLSQRFSRAILLGLIRAGEPRPRLNPAPDVVLESGDMLVFLARRFEDCVPEPAGDVQQQTVNAEQPLRPIEDTHRVLILGWSRKVPALLRELARFGTDSFEIDIVSGTPVAEREADLDRYLGSTMTLSVKHFEAGYATPGVIEELEPERYHNIVVLASELLADKEHADAVSVAAALRLRGCLSDRDQRSTVMVELLDYENLNLFHGGCEDVIVSPAVVSYVVSQVALQRELASVFWELTGPRGGQIVLQPAESFVGTDGKVRFDQVQQIAAAQGVIAIGFRLPSDPDDRLVLNPDRDTEWSIESGDEVVLLTSIKGPEN